VLVSMDDIAMLDLCFHIVGLEATNRVLDLETQEVTSVATSTATAHGLINAD